MIGAEEFVLSLDSACGGELFASGGQDACVRAVEARDAAINAAHAKALAALTAERDEAIEEGKRLLALLAHHGEHEEGCPAIALEEGECECGFAEALSPAAKKESGK